jgi:CHASE2 domain-containing sensor protein
MSEPGRFSLEWLVAELPAKRTTFLAALVVAIVAVFWGRELLIKIPELVETSYGYDAQLRATVANRSLAMDGLPVTFVDVDDAAIRAWGGATRTMPREKLAALMASVAKKQPKLIFLDFDLSGTATGDGDQKFGDFVRAYPATSPPLLLTAEVLPLECKGEQCSSKPCDAKVEPKVRLSATPFDQIVSGKQNALWVSSRFLPEEDGVVRSWHLWDYACGEQRVGALASAQLAAAALSASNGDGRQRLERYLKYIAQPDPGDDGIWPKNKEAQDALIPFLIGGSATAEVSDLLRSGNFRYQRVHAESVLDDQVADSALKDRIIVIGASYGPDKFATPFGVMPGATLMANAISVAPAILANAPRHRTVIALMLVLALIYGAIAKTFRAIPAALVIGIFSFIWLSLATYWLNPADAVNTVSLALMTLGAFLALESVIEIFVDVFEGKRLSAILRSPKEPNTSHPAKLEKRS